MDPPGLNAPLLADGGQRPPQYGQPLSRVPTDKSLDSSGYQSKTSNYDSRDFHRGPPWPRRSSNASQDDTKSARFDSDRNGSIRYPDNRTGTRFNRDYDRDKDRDRERDRRGTDFSTRYEKPRYIDNRRPYEPRGAPPLRGSDSKSSVDAPPLSSRPLDERTIPDSRAPRPSGEDRSFDSRRPLNDDRAPEARRPIDDHPLDSRGSRQFWDDRQPESRDSRPQERSLESRLSRPPGEDRFFNGRPPPDDRDPRDRRPLPPSDERLVKPTIADDRVPKGLPDERRSLPDRAVRPDDDRRLSQLKEIPSGTPSSSYSRNAPPVATDTVPPQPPSRLSAPTTALADATTRPIDDRRPPAPSTVDRALPPSDRPAVSSAALADRAVRSTDERRPSEDYPARAPVGATGSPPESRSLDRVPPRPLPPQDSRAITRPPIPNGSHEERNGRTPSLQDRISARPGEPPLARPAGDDRVPTPLDRPPRPAPEATSATRPPSEPAQISTKPVDTRPSAVPPALSDRIQRPDERGRPPTNDRSGPPPARYYSKPRPLSPPRDDGPRTFKPRGNTVSPRRPEYRPVDRTYPDRYERERSPERRPDTLDVDRRFGDRPSAGYRRPSPLPFNRDRTWTDNFANDASRRHPTDAPPPHTYTREWREEDRPVPGAGFEDWERGRDWERSRPPPPDRDRDYERDPRFVDSSWETREERERRVGSTFPPPPAPNVADAPPPRPFETRPLSARLSDGYPPAEDRERDRTYDRSRYPPMDTNPAGYSRVRMRSPSPSPIRRPGAADELNRPPLKRARDDAYGPPGYYSTPPPGSIDPPRDYPPSRLRSPPPAPPGPYYDDAREYPPRGVSPAGSVRERERDFPERDGYPPYDRRDPPSGRMPPPRASPSYNRPPYARDDRRYARP